jgi:hypothetical protein
MLSGLGKSCWSSTTWLLEELLSLAVSDDTVPCNQGSMSIVLLLKIDHK